MMKQSTVSRPSPKVSQPSGKQRAALLTLVFFALRSIRPFAQTVYTPYPFGTFAGDTFIGSSDGPGSRASFYQPAGMATDSQGNLYVADSANHTIRKIAPD